MVSICFSGSWLGDREGVSNSPRGWIARHSRLACLRHIEIVSQIISRIKLPSQAEGSNEKQTDNLQYENEKQIECFSYRNDIFRKWQKWEVSYDILLRKEGKKNYNFEIGMNEKSRFSIYIQPKVKVKTSETSKWPPPFNTPFKFYSFELYWCPGGVFPSRPPSNSNNWNLLSSSRAYHNYSNAISDFKIKSLTVNKKTKQKKKKNWKKHSHNESHDIFWI